MIYKAKTAGCLQKLPSADAGLACFAKSTVLRRCGKRSKARSRYSSISIWHIFMAARAAS